MAQYEDSYLLCYVRGPSGIIVALAEQLGWQMAADPGPVHLPIGL